MTDPSRMLRDGGVFEVRAGADENRLAVVWRAQTVAEFRWEAPPSALAYLDIDDRCYELVGTRRRTGRRGIEAWWAGEAVARLDIGLLGKAKQVATRSGSVYRFRRTGLGTVLERDGASEPAMTIMRWAGRGRRTYELHGGEGSEEELGAIVGVIVIYMVWNDQSQNIGALGAGTGG